MNRFIVQLVFCSALISCTDFHRPKPIQPTTYRWPVMGTFFEIQWSDQNSSTETVSKQIFEQIKRVDEKVSIYKQTSDLSKLNQSAGSDRWIPIDSITQDLLEHSIKYGKETGGTFNIAVGPLMKLWKLFLPVQGEEKPVPTSSQIRAGLQLLDVLKIEVKPGFARIQKKGMELDMGGIAKGYALDLAFQTIQRPMPCGYMNLGRQLMIIGDCKEPLQFAILNPDSKEKSFANLYLANGSVSTSGGYEKYFAHGGSTYGHILDPRTGQPVQNNLRSVTVWSKDATETDVMSTTLFVLGYEKGSGFLAKYGDSIGVCWMFSNGEIKYQDSKFGKIMLTEK